MKVAQVKCPQCSEPIYMKQKDEMFYCKNCGTIHNRDVHGIHRVPYEIADARAPANGKLYYMPFWRLYCNISIRSRNVQGGALYKLAAAFTGGDKGGRVPIYVPASDLDVSTFRQWAVQLTTDPPRYNTRTDFAEVERVPATVLQEDALELADFVVVTLEAEKPGTLQYLDYELKVLESKLVYLPFAHGGGGLSLFL
ncbi:hypothetical protein [Methanomassiliicoccus luminyensis]|uniref:hypothetical protein n=1 Tax=Methanomassiliicoccus luminyensis TaxID=1080712 RepID=UPI000371F653|nr:hypothetical protein [Methanomassiliicoccus luminyensis]